MLPLSKDVRAYAQNRVKLIRKELTKINPDGDKVTETCNEIISKILD